MRQNAAAPEQQATPGRVGGGRRLTGGRQRRPGNPIARFVIVFALLMALYYIWSVTPWYGAFFRPYLRLNTTISAALLTQFGQDVEVADVTIRSKRFAMEVRRGCDAVEPSALFVAAVLAFPALLRARLVGVLVGTALLATLNIVRIVTLYWVGVFWPRLFDVMHIQVWQATFILLALLFWVIWAWWATRARTPGANATT
ncbi:MAG: exosortase H [Planctomycetes bacterium]|nr:exosortase H [Planctomycetota bacterium]